MSRQKIVVRFGFLVALLVCAMATSQLPATEQTTEEVSRETAGGSDQALDSRSTAPRGNLLAALEILDGAFGPDSAEPQASPFEPPGHGGTPPGQGGTPPGQSTPPGKGGTPPGQQ